MKLSILCSRRVLHLSLALSLTMSFTTGFVSGQGVVNQSQTVGSNNLISSSQEFSLSHLKKEDLQAPTTIAGAAVLIDADTNEILFEKNPDKWMHPASTTKVVTLLTALDLKGKQLDELSHISYNATAVEPSHLGIRVGDQLMLQDLLEGMMVASGNDAAIAVAETVSGSVDAFAQEMNRVARQAGAKNSNFLNPHGLTQAGHHSTARDLALMSAYGMKNKQFRYMVNHDYYEVPYQNRGHEQVRTTNLFIRNKYPGANGLKTGYTQAAGDCLIASAERNGHTLIAVFLNDDDRWTDAPKFLDYGFSQLENKK